MCALKRREQRGPRLVGALQVIVEQTVVFAAQHAIRENALNVLFQRRDVLGALELVRGIHQQREALHELVFQVLRTAEASEPAVYHDREACAQRFALVHAVRRDDQAAAFGADAAQRVPQQSPGDWVHAGRRFVEEDHEGVSDKGYRGT